MVVEPGGPLSSCRQDLRRVRLFEHGVGLPEGSVFIRRQDEWLVERRDRRVFLKGLAASATATSVDRLSFLHENSRLPDQLIFVLLGSIKFNGLEVRQGCVVSSLFLFRQRPDPPSHQLDSPQI